MSSSREEALSPDELRKRLYQTFKSKGLLDTLKTQLRNQLIQELKHPPLAQGKSSASVNCQSGLIVACNTIVADYLRNSGYEYSLSIFNPECGMNKDKMLPKQDILQLMKISPGSSLFRALMSPKNCDRSFLMSLLTELGHCPINEQGHDVLTQTSNMSRYGESLVEKLKEVDKEYENHNYRGDTFFSFQSKMELYKKEIEERLQAEMKIKLQHFKEVELAKVQMEEKAKFNKDLIKMKHELEETYEIKTKALMEREKNAIARLQKQQEIEEKSAYMQRQEVLKEMEAVRNRESELRIKMDAFEKNCQIHEEKVKTTVELLRRREVAVKTMEDTHDQRLKNELSRYQLELKEEFVKRTEQLTENETRNKIETARILKERAELNSKLEEHVRACAEIKQLEIELNMAQQQHSILTDQKELLKEKLETMSDYTSLKTERVELQGQLRLLAKQLEEALEEKNHLHADVKRSQSVQRKTEEDSDKQKQVLQAQLQSERECNAQLRAQLMESEEKAKWMNKHVDDIKTQLQQTQQALENEVLRNPKPSLVDRSCLEICRDNLVPPDVYVDKNILKAAASYDMFKSDRFLHGQTWETTLDSDMDLIADAKARMLELQREAETIEEAYRNYQQRAVVSNISHMLTQRPLSPSYHPESTVRRVPLSKVTKTPILTSYNNRKPNENQPKGTFLEIPAETQPLSSVHHSLTEHVFARDRHYEDENLNAAGHTIPSHELSSIIHPLPSRNIHPEELRQDDAQRSHHEAAPSHVLPPVLSSPQLRSTARDTTSQSKLKPTFSSSESSPQPEKISLEDLTEPLPEPSHIPELLLDTSVPEGPTVPRLQSPQDLQQDPPAAQIREGSQSSHGSSIVEQSEDEEEKWELERKERLEQRLREQEEARERELQELERLEKEHLLQIENQATPHKEETDTNHCETLEEQEAKDDGKESVVEENPLEKYMKMVLEAREKQKPTSPEQESNPISFEEKSLLEEKDGSIAASSHKDEDDDFW